MEKTKKDANGRCSDAVRYLMEHHAPKALSQGGLAKLSGVSQGTICMNLKGERGWSLVILEKICPFLGVAMEDLISIGKALQKSNDVFPWPSMLRNTVPGSDARLRALILAAVGDTQLAKLINPLSVKENLPNEYARYMEGKLSDGSLYQALREKFASASQEVNWISELDEESIDIFYGEKYNE